MGAVPHGQSEGFARLPAPRVRRAARRGNRRSPRRSALGAGRARRGRARLGRSDPGNPGQRNTRQYDQALQALISFGPLCPRVCSSGIAGRLRVPARRSVASRGRLRVIGPRLGPARKRRRIRPDFLAALERFRRAAHHLVSRPGNRANQPGTRPVSAGYRRSEGIPRRQRGGPDRAGAGLAASARRALRLGPGAGEPRPARGDPGRRGQGPRAAAGRLARRLRGVPRRKTFPDAPDARRPANYPGRGSMDKLNPWERRYPAPAKLNLFLHVVGRRPDGYHLLQTAFRIIELCDWLRFAPRADAEVRRAQDVPGVAESEDLALRAARLLQAQGGSSLGVDIEIEKNIPIGGGLGGGQSHCAPPRAVPYRPWGVDLPKGKLPAMALPLWGGLSVVLFFGDSF